MAEIKRALEYGANEIDIVITRTFVPQGNWQALYDEVRACQEVKYFLFSCFVVSVYHS